MKPQNGERGYALVAAVLSIAVFAALALMILQATRGTLITAVAEVDRARLTAAADAGIAIALQELMQDEPVRQGPIDGTIRERRYNGYRLAIAVEDERGKIALNAINQRQAERMFLAFGLRGTALETAVDSFLDWRDRDDEPRLNGAESETYARRGLRARNGDLRTTGELALINGVGREIAARIMPIATVDLGINREFDPRNATPIARDVAAADVASFGADYGGVAPIDAKPVNSFDTLIGRPMTIRVDAYDPLGGHARRRVVIELINETPGYVVRARE